MAGSEGFNPSMDFEYTGVVDELGSVFFNPSTDFEYMSSMDTELPSLPSLETSGSCHPLELDLSHPPTIAEVSVRNW